MTNNTMAACKEVFKLAKENDAPLNYRQLAAILYYSQLASYYVDEEFLMDEEFTPLVFGPTIMSVFMKYAEPAIRPDVPGGWISDNIIVDEELLKMEYVDEGVITEKGRAAILAIWNELHELEGNELMNMTKENSVFKKAIETNDGVVDRAVIKAEYDE